jgi:hypothetical protein
MIPAMASINRDSMTIDVAAEPFAPEDRRDLRDCP